MSPSPDPAPQLREAAWLRARAAEFLARAAELEAEVSGTEAARPPRPTRAWCLPAPGRVRWDGATTIPLRRWHLLEALLVNGPIAGVGDLEEVVGESRSPGFRALLSRLNRDLEAVRWPGTYHLRGDSVTFE